MKSLLQSNPYLADPQTREEWLWQNARESSMFEGARGLPHHPPVVARKRRLKAAAKKAAKGS